MRECIKNSKNLWGENSEKWIDLLRKRVVEHVRNDG